MPLLPELCRYLVAAKKMSGAVKTSDAEQLWTESRSIREWSADRISELTKVIGALEVRVKNVEDRNTTLVDENEALEQTIEKLRTELVACRSAIENLTKELARAEAHIDVLTTQNKEKES